MRLKFLGPMKSQDGRISFMIESQNSKNVRMGYINGRINGLKNCIECDYAVATEYRGRGIAGKMLEFMLDKVFKDNALSIKHPLRVVLNIDAENQPSRHVAEKAGFEKIDSESRDSVEYEMTPKQYELNIRKRTQAIQQNLPARNI